MTGTVTKGQIFRGDQANYDGLSLSATRTDSTGGTKTGNRIGDEVDVLTVYGGGTSFTGGAIQRALNAIGTSNYRTLSLAPGAWTISSNLTVPSNITLRVAAGAILTPSAGITMTINGPLFRMATSYTGGSGTVTVNGYDNIGSQTTTKRTIWVPAGAWIARTTNGAAVGTSETTTNKVMLRTFDFDQTTAEYIQCMIQMPKSWNEGTITYDVVWTAASGSGTVSWNLQAVATSEGDALDASFGTAIELEDALTTALDNHTTSESSAVTIAGTPAEKDLVCFQLYRNPSDSNDNFSADAKFIGAHIYYTVNTSDDT